jgi:hypothetical protein
VQIAKYKVAKKYGGLKPQQRSHIYLAIKWLNTPGELERTIFTGRRGSNVNF